MCITMMPIENNSTSAATTWPMELLTIQHTREVLVECYLKITLSQ